jgi:hypothetical protein
VDLVRTTIAVTVIEDKLDEAEFSANWMVLKAGNREKASE